MLLFLVFLFYKDKLMGFSFMIYLMILTYQFHNILCLILLIHHT